MDQMLVTLLEVPEEESTCWCPAVAASGLAACPHQTTPDPLLGAMEKMGVHAMNELPLLGFRFDHLGLKAEEAHVEADRPPVAGASKRPTYTPMPVISISLKSTARALNVGSYSTPKRRGWNPSGLEVATLKDPAAALMAARAAGRPNGKGAR